MLGQCGSLAPLRACQYFHQARAHAPRRLPRGCLNQQHAQTENIRGGLTKARALARIEVVFRRRVRGRTQQVIAVPNIGARLHRLPCCCASHAEALSKVGKQRRTLCRKEHIVGLYVIVRQAALMRVRQRPGHLRTHRCSLCSGQPGGRQARSETPTRAKLHNHEQPSRAIRHAQYAHNVGVRELRKDGALAARLG
jgi:hypothetical protein